MLPAQMEEVQLCWKATATFTGPGGSKFPPLGPEISPEIHCLLCLGVSLPIPVLALFYTITMWTQLSVTPIAKSCSAGTKSTFPVDGQLFESVVIHWCSRNYLPEACQTFLCPCKILSDFHDFVSQFLCPPVAMKLSRELHGCSWIINTDNHLFSPTTIK